MFGILPGKHGMPSIDHVCFVPLVLPCETPPLFFHWDALTLRCIDMEVGKRGSEVH